MKRTVLGATMAMLPIAALAMTLNWQIPTKDVNGDPITTADLAGYLALCGDSNKGPFTSSYYFPGGATTSGEVDEPFGYCVLKAVNTDGESSADSNVAGKPAPPGGVNFHWLTNQ